MFKDPVFVSLYLLVYGAFWILFCGILARLTGWHSLATRHTIPEILELKSTHRFGSVQVNSLGSYTYSMVISIHTQGILLEPMLLFRAFHRPIFIPWDSIIKAKTGKEFFWYETLDLYIEENKIRFYGNPIGEILPFVKEKITS